MAVWSGLGSTGTAVGGVAVAAAVVVVGVVGFRETEPDAPVPVEDPVEASVTVAPEETTPKPEETATEASQRTPPSFDVVQVEADGTTMVAGRAEPRSSVAVLVDGQEMHRANADGGGTFAFFFNVPPAQTARTVSLVMDVDGQASLRSTGTVLIQPVEADATVVAETEQPTDQPAANTDDTIAANTTGTTDAVPETVAVAALEEPTLDTPIESGTPADKPIAAESADPKPKTDVPATDANAPASERAKDTVQDDSAGPEIVASVEPDTPASAEDAPVALGTADDETRDTAPAQDIVALATDDPVAMNDPVGEADQVASSDPIKVDDDPVASDVVATDVTTESPTDTVQVATKDADPDANDVAVAVAGSELSPDRTEDVVEDAPEVAVDAAQPSDDASQAAEDTPQLVTDAPAAPEIKPTDDTIVVALADPNAADPVQPSSLNIDVGNSPELGLAPGQEDNTLARPGSESSAPSQSEPKAPSVLLADDTGIRVLQSGGGTQVSTQTVIIDTISYDPTGEVALGGRGSGAGFVRVYLNNRPIKTTRISRDGQWRTPLPEVDTGVYTLRVDQLNEEGEVTSRMETPFKREEPEVVAALDLREDDAKEDTGVITVQPGNTLWGIATEKYGDGLLYVRVFKANRDRIRNPDLIYPGQVFEIPE